MLLLTIYRSFEIFIKLFSEKNSNKKILTDGI